MSLDISISLLPRTDEMNYYLFLLPVYRIHYSNSPHSYPVGILISSKLFKDKENEELDTPSESPKFQ